MMTNLFSIFDPSTGSFSFNWLSSFIIILFIFLMFWVLPSRLCEMFIWLYGLMVNEIKVLVSGNNQGNFLYMTSLFIFILMNNLLGLIPYIFTSSSHLVFCLSMAMPMWLSFMFYGWIVNTNYMFKHLIPAGTPGVLMPFMVLIETVSNLMRPGSLSVQLTANMIAGHLLMCLLGDSTLNVGFLFIYLMIFMQIVLMCFEVAVCFIQSYVFTILGTLYSKEVMGLYE